MVLGIETLIVSGVYSSHWHFLMCIDGVGWSAFLLYGSSSGPMNKCCVNIDCPLPCSENWSGRSLDTLSSQAERFWDFCRKTIIYGDAVYV